MFLSVTSVSLQTVLQFCNPHILLNLLSNILSEAASLKAQLVKKSTCNAGDPGSIPEWGRTAGEC